MSATTFFYPVVKEPTGRVQFALNRAAAIDIDRIGEVRRGQVITIGPPNKPPTPKALDFARSLVASGNFSHVAADTPLGIPLEFAPDLSSDERDAAAKAHQKAREEERRAFDLQALQDLRDAGAFSHPPKAEPPPSTASITESTEE